MSTIAAPGRSSAGIGQLTAESRSAEVDRETLVYRRFGNDITEAPPLLCL
jgi:hypothetical protein